MDNFIKLFNNLAMHKHRYNVFQDFVTVSAISLYNSVYKNPEREAEYQQIMRGYSKAEVAVFPQLFAELVNLLDSEPRDILGELYMTLELGNQQAGQFFTPPTISDLMAQMTFSDQLEKMEQSFITLSDPACGAGSTLLSFVKLTISKGYNPAENLWVQGIDIDRTVALMCYTQLVLWNVPAQILIGDSLSSEMRETWYTPAHLLGFWNIRLKNQRIDEDNFGKTPSHDNEKLTVNLVPTVGAQLSLF